MFSMPTPTFTPAMNASHETIPPPYTGTASTGTAVTTMTDMLKPPTTPPAAARSSLALPSEQLLPPRTYKREGFFRRHMGFWRALPCALGAIFWSAQMIYFLFYFITRPAQQDGSWPRIGPSYAMFPFISCVGAVRELSFKSVSILVAVLLWTGFGIDYVVGARAPVGIWWRRGKLITSSVSSVFLIALSFTSVDVNHKLHLIFTSFQIICMGMAKLCDWNLAREMREWTPNNRFLARVKLWKRIAAVVAGPSSIMAIIGIYGCTAKFDFDKVVFTPVCWSLVSFAAPAEWTLSWCWVIFLGTVSYDSYHLDYTVRLILNTPAPQKPKSNGLAFWRKWTRKNSGFGRKMEAWDTEREGLTHGVAPLADTSPDPSHVRVESDSGGGQNARRPSPRSTAGTFKEELDDEDVTGVLLHDGDVNLGWLPPTMPQSVFGASGYQQLRGSPHIGEA